jgi:hypothetical protein
MDFRRKFTATLVSAVIVAIPAISHAADVSWQGFLSSGSKASTLEGKINNFLLTKTVQDFGYSIYQQGRSYGTAGGQQEQVTSTPQIGFVQKHRSAYCSPNISAEVQGLQCKGQNIDDPAAPYLEMGDVNFAAVIDPTIYTNLSDLTAQNLIRNIVSPFPDPTIKTSVTSPGFLDDGGKKTDYANYMAGQAVLGVALNSFNKIYGDRIPGSALGLGNTDPAQNTSLMQLIQQQSTQRYEQSAWAQYLADPGTNELAVLKEIAAMQAFSLWMDYQRYAQMERIESLLAAALAKMVNDSYQNNKLIASASPPPRLPSNK